MSRSVGLTTVIFRSMAVLTGIVVLALITDRGRIRCEICIFNNRDTPCRLGQAVGAISFVLGTVVLVADVALLLAEDVVTERIRLSPWVQRAMESCVSFCVTILWIVCFAVLFREWNERNFSLRRALEHDNFRRDIDGQAILAFCFIGFGLWLALCVMGIVRWCKTPFPGKKEDRQRGNTPDQNGAPAVGNNWQPGNSLALDHGTQPNGTNGPAYGNHLYM